MEKTTQIFTIIKYLKKILNLFVYHLFWLILFFEQVKTIIPQYFWKNVNVLLKKKTMPECITDNTEILSDSDKEDSDDESSNEEN